MGNSKNYDNDFSKYADSMLDNIINCVKSMMQEVPKIKSAIVHNVNEDGTVNVKLPGDDEHIYTRIQNQSIYQDLQQGDMVKLLLENGSFSNCWIIARYPRVGEDNIFKAKEVVINSTGGGTKIILNKEQPPKEDMAYGDIWLKEL